MAKNTIRIKTDYEAFVGIDTGTHTGVAIWLRKSKKIAVVDTMRIHQAMGMVKALGVVYGQQLLIRFEDARLRTWFGTKDAAQLQGAGSIKRDAAIWEDFLKDAKIDYEAVAPKNNKTKLSASLFQQMTGWTESTDEHGRDAAMLVFNF